MRSSSFAEISASSRFGGEDRRTQSIQSRIDNLKRGAPLEVTERAGADVVEYDHRTLDARLHDARFTHVEPESLAKLGIKLRHASKRTPNTALDLVANDRSGEMRLSRASRSREKKSIARIRKPRDRAFANRTREVRKPRFAISRRKCAANRFFAHARARHGASFRN